MTEATPKELEAAQSNAASGRTTDQHAGADNEGRDRRSDSPDDGLAERWRRSLHGNRHDPSAAEREQIRRDGLLYQSEESLPRINRLQNAGATSFGGDATQYIFVGGLGDQPAEPAVAQVPSDRIRSRRDSYAPPEHHAALLSRLSTRRIQILAGKSSSGRQTTALSALCDLVGDKAVMTLDIPGHPGLASLLKGSLLEAGTGYFCAASESLTAPTITTLEALSSQLREKNGYLLLVASHTANWIPEVDPAYLVYHRLADPIDILRAQLRSLTTEGRTEQLLGRPDVEEEARLRVAPHALRRLATEIGSLRDEDLDSDHRWRQHGARKLVEECLSTPSDNQRGSLAAMRRSALLFSCSTLNDGPLADVLDAASLMVGILYGTRSEYRPAPTEILDFSIETELAEVGADCEVDERGQRRIRVPPILAHHAFSFGWQQKFDLRKPLITWLRQLTENHTASAWRPAAQTIGSLAAHDFEYIWRTVLDSWARSNDRTQNDAAALALEVVTSAAPELIDDVQDKLRRWAYSLDRKAVRTALSAWNTRLAHARPEQTLDTLCWLAQRRGHQYDLLLSLALSTTFEAFDLVDVLETLVSWDENQFLRTHAARCFVRLATTTPTAVHAAFRDVSTAPGLLHRLWRHALVDPWIAEDALEALFEWAEQTHEPRDSEDPTNMLVAELMSDPQLHKRLKFRADVYRFSDRTIPFPIYRALKEHV